MTHIWTVTAHHIGSDAVDPWVTYFNTLDAARETVLDLIERQFPDNYRAGVAERTIARNEGQPVHITLTIEDSMGAIKAWHVRRAVDSDTWRNQL